MLPGGGGMYIHPFPPVYSLNLNPSIFMEYNDQPFLSDDFHEVLERYENMIKDNGRIYFDCDDLIDLAEYYAYNKMPKKSSEVIEYAQTLHPDNQDIQLYQCRILLINGNAEEALEKLNSLPDQTDREVTFLRAEILLDMEEDAKADEELKRLAADELYSKETVIDIANLYMDSNLPDKAYEWGKDLFEKYPDDKEVSDLMYRCLYDSEDYDAAIEIVNKRLDENPYSEYEWMKLARCYMSQENASKAIEALEFALSINDKSTDVLECMAFCLMQMQETKKACQVWKKLQKIVPDSFAAIHGLSACYFDMGKYKQSAAYTTKLIDFKGERPAEYNMAEIYQMRARAYLMTKEFEKCEADLDKAVSISPQNASIYLTMASCHSNLDKREKVIEDLGYAELYAGNDYPVVYELALMYIKYALFDDAIRLMEKYEDIFKDKFEKFYPLLTYCHWVKGDKRKALEYMEKNPLSPVLLMEMLDDEELYKILNDMLTLHDELHNNDE